MKDFSIIIAHRGDPMGLWATIQSCEIDLADTKFDYEYRICVNGEKLHPRNTKNKEDYCNPDLIVLLDTLQRSGKLGFRFHSPEAMSPPNARQLAAKDAEGKLLFFFDNHCLVERNYFKRAVLDFEHYPMDMLHSSTRFFTGGELSYHYKLCLEKNFWASSDCVGSPHRKPYRIAAAGHGGFVVKADVWREMNGYWDGFTGYGGEEMYFDLKMAMLDKSNWLDPLVVHHHYAGVRPYDRHYSDDFYRNMLMCANIIGGEAWMYKVFDSFSTKFLKMKSNLTMYEILMQAQVQSAQRAAEFATQRHRTLDEQLALFSQQQIAC
jgi:hypothetical protein